MCEKEICRWACAEDRADAFLIESCGAGEPRFEKDGSFAVQKVGRGPVEPEAIEAIRDETGLSREQKNLRQ
jgi:hypothetical protein